LFPFLTNIIYHVDNEFVVLFFPSLFSVHEYSSVSAITHAKSPALKKFRNFFPLNLFYLYKLLQQFILILRPMGLFVDSSTLMEVLEFGNYDIHLFLVSESIVFLKLFRNIRTHRMNGSMNNRFDCFRRNVLLSVKKVGVPD